MATYEIKARDVIDWTALVEADSEAEALAKFEAGDIDAEIGHDRYLYDGGDQAVEVT